MIIGITGQSGAGKTSVCDSLAQFNIPIIKADLIAREVVKSKDCKERLARRFGEDIIKNGELDRATLASRAFSTRENTDALNQITHPLIVQMMLACADGHSTVIFDASQLFESGLDKKCDLIIGITADENVRLSRIINRDNLTVEQAKLRISAGLSDGFFIKNCDYIIKNNGDKTVNDIAAAIYKIILERAAEI